MVAHYGQTPKQLFSSMHPRSMWCSVENCEMVCEIRTLYRHHVVQKNYNCYHCRKYWTL